MSNHKTQKFTNGLKLGSLRLWSYRRTSSITILNFGLLLPSWTPCYTDSLNQLTMSLNYRGRFQEMKRSLFGIFENGNPNHYIMRDALKTNFVLIVLNPDIVSMGEKSKIPLLGFTRLHFIMSFPTLLLSFAHPLYHSAQCPVYLDGDIGTYFS